MIKCTSVILLVVILNNGLLAQDNNIIKKGKSLLKSGEILKPNLNGHNFTTTPQTKSPFIQTYLQLGLGVGQTVGLDPVTIKLDTFTYSKKLSGEVVYTGMLVEFSTKLRDWISFWANAQINGRLGTKGVTLISQGVNLSVGYEFGWMFKLWENKKNLLSGTVSISNNSITLVDIEEFVHNIIDTGKFDPDITLVQTYPSLAAVGGLRYATAFNKSFGMIALFEFGYGEKIKSSTDGAWVFNGGAAFDYDLLPKTGVPVGFSLGYFQNSYSNLADHKVSNPQNILTQISYTGKQDLNLGLVFSYSWTSNPEGKYYNTLSFMSIQGNIKYYF